MKPFHNSKKVHKIYTKTSSLETFHYWSFRPKLATLTKKTSSQVCFCRFWHVFQSSYSTWHLGTKTFKCLDLSNHAWFCINKIMFQLFKITIICANETEDISSRNRHWEVFQIKAVLERFCKSHKNTSAKESFLSMLQIKFQKKSSRILFTFSQSITGKF